MVIFICTSENYYTWVTTVLSKLWHKSAEIVGGYPLKFHFMVVPLTNVDQNIFLGSWQRGFHLYASIYPNTLKRRKKELIMCDHILLRPPMCKLKRLFSWSFLCLLVTTMFSWIHESMDDHSMEAICQIQQRDGRKSSLCEPVLRPDFAHTAHGDLKVLY